jgi:hypothetical protein
VWDRRGNPERAGNLEPDTRPLTSGGSKDFTRVIAEDFCEMATCGTELQIATGGTASPTSIDIDDSRPPAACREPTIRPPEGFGVDTGPPAAGSVSVGDPAGADSAEDKSTRPPAASRDSDGDAADDKSTGQPWASSDGDGEQSTGPPWAISDGDGDSADDKSTGPPAATSDSDGDSADGKVPDPWASSDGDGDSADVRQSMPHPVEGDDATKRWADFDSSSEASEQAPDELTSEEVWDNIAAIKSIAEEVGRNRQAYIDEGGVDAAVLLGFENTRQSTGRSIAAYMFKLASLPAECVSRAGSGYSSVVEV